MPGNQPRIGILHAPFGAAGLPEIGRSARGAYQPVILFRERVAERYPDLVRLAQRLFEAQILPEREALGICRRLGLDGLTTYQDGELDYADEIAATLGLPCAPQNAHTWDKLVQRQVLAGRDLTRIRARPVDSRDDLGTAVAEIGLPAVLKPRRGTASGGVAFIDGPEDIDYQQKVRRRWAGLLLESRLPTGVHPVRPAKLADYVSVETFTTDIHHHVAVNDKTPISVVRRAGADGADSVHETGNRVPSCLPEDVTADLLRYVSQVLSALAVRWRVTHTEVRLTPYGPELIEVNGRTAGYIPRLLRLVGGADLVRGAMALAVGEQPGIPQDTCDSAAMVLMPPFPERAGLVRSTVTAAELRPVKAVVGVDEVAVAGQPRSATGFRMAVLVLHTPDLAQLEYAEDVSLQAIMRAFAADLPRPPVRCGGTVVR